MEGNVATTEVKKRWRDLGSRVDFLKALPELTEDDYVTKEDLMKVILYYSDKCCDNTEKKLKSIKMPDCTKELMKRHKTLSSTSSLQEVTLANEILIVEHDLCTGDAKYRKEAFGQEKPDVSNLMISFGYITPVDCLRGFIKQYFRVGTALIDIEEKLKGMPKDHSSETETTADADGASSSETNAFDLSKKGLTHRLESLSNIKIVINAGLSLLNLFYPL